MTAAASAPEAETTELEPLRARFLTNIRTGNLGPWPVVIALALVNRLAEQGLSVILISHNLHDIFETAHRISVLRLGRNAGMFDRAKTTQEEVVHAITAGQPTKVSGIPGTVTA